MARGRMIARRCIRFTRGRRVVAGVILGVLLPVLAPRAQGALLVQGTVRDEQGRPVANATIVALTDAAQTQSDARGAFTLRLAGDEPATSAGARQDARGGRQSTRRISVRRFGFAPLLLHVESDGAVYHAAQGTPARARERAQPVTRPIEVHLRRAAAPLEAIVVHGRREAHGALAGFYSRREMGHGRFFTAEDVERRGARRMTDLFRGVPGFRTRPRNFVQSDVRLRGATIAPLVWLDGVPLGTHDVDIDRFDPRTFAGIEIYSGSASVPLQFAGGPAMSTSGGTIVLWSRQGEAVGTFGGKSDARGEPGPLGIDAQSDGRTQAERDALAASSALVTRLLERGEAYTADLVSVPARALRPIQPHYPASLNDAHVAGRVEVEFVVDATGHPRMDTFGVVHSTHPELVQAVRLALSAERQEFAPATLDGRPVAQLVQQPFEFRLDGRQASAQQRD